MPIADWTVPFNLTSSVYSGSLLPFNTQTTTGIYLLHPQECHLANAVRMNKTHVPQADGDILHRRFVAGMEMSLTVQLWETIGNPACGATLQTMTDTFLGYAYGLLNAGDNQGRISWTPAGQSVRMLDDIRLMTYPEEKQEEGGPLSLSMIIDCNLPYSQNLTQSTPSLTGGTGTVTNAGNRPSYPVWQIYGPYSAFTLTNTTVTPNVAFSWSEAQPGAGAALLVNEYIEIDTFNNTATKVVPGPTLSNVEAGIVMTSSEFFQIPPGANAITVGYTGGGAGNNSSQALINAAWA